MGGKMDLMLDPFCAIKNFGDALKLGWTCDEEKFFWYEDPFKDGGVSAHPHRKLGRLIKTHTASVGAPARPGIAR